MTREYDLLNVGQDGSKMANLKNVRMDIFQRGLC